jgi:hypothetical protein
MGLSDLENWESENEKGDCLFKRDSLLWQEKLYYVARYSICFIPTGSFYGHCV